MSIKQEKNIYKTILEIILEILKIKFYKWRLNQS